MPIPKSNYEKRIKELEEKAKYWEQQKRIAFKNMTRSRKLADKVREQYFNYKKENNLISWEELLDTTNSNYSKIQYRDKVLAKLGFQPCSILQTENNQIQIEFLTDNLPDKKMFEQNLTTLLRHLKPCNFFLLPRHKYLEECVYIILHTRKNKIYSLFINTKDNKYYIFKIPLRHLFSRNNPEIEGKLDKLYEEIENINKQQELVCY